MNKRLLFLFLICITAFSCQRRDLTYEYESGLLVHINVDWKNVPQGDEIPLYLKAKFYPVDGSKVVERFVESTGSDVTVPQGEYNIILYTWRINAQAQTVQFRNSTFLDFEAYTDETSRSKQKTKTEDDEPIIIQPDDYMYSWSSIDEPFLLTKKALAIMTKSENITKYNITAEMVNMVSKYLFQVDIINYKEIASIEIMVTGANGWVRLGDGTLSDKTFSLDIDQNILSGDDITGQFDMSFTTFGMAEVSINTIVINTTNHDGIKQEFEILVKDIIDKIDDKEIINDTRYDLTDDDYPIIIIPAEKKQEGGGFIPPTINDWGEGGNHDIEI